MVTLRDGNLYKFYRHVILPFFPVLDEALGNPSAQILLDHTMCSIPDYTRKKQYILVKNSGNIFLLRIRIV